MELNQTGRKVISNPANILESNWLSALLVTKPSLMLRMSVIKEFTTRVQRPKLSVRREMIKTADAQAPSPQTAKDQKKGWGQGERSQL